MHDKNVMIGMKVRIHSKSVGCTKEDFDIGFVNGIVGKGKYIKEAYYVSYAIGKKRGNHYLAKDFEPVELTKPKEGLAYE